MDRYEEAFYAEERAKQSKAGIENPTWRQSLKHCQRQSNFGCVMQPKKSEHL